MGKILAMQWPEAQQEMDEFGAHHRLLPAIPAVMKIIPTLSTLIIIYYNLKPIQNQNVSIDPNGYLVYCPCMGRFGNQAEQLLGTLQFAKSIDRTLILPPFIEYIDYKVNFIPFEDLFDVDLLGQYHRVMVMKQFLSDLAPIVWPENQRTIACYAPRNFPNNKQQVYKEDDCNPLEGSPFKEFWYHLGVREFPAGSLFYRPLHTDYNFAKEWKERFRRIKVLALVGAPSSFPTNSRAVKLSKYIKFNQNFMEKAQKYREERGFAREPYLAIHLRHGPDWIRACELIHSNPDLKQLFSSQQCLQQANNDDDGDDDKLSPITSNLKKITFDLCLPSFEQIIERIDSSLETYNNDKNQLQPIKHIYIATDMNNESLWLELNETIHQRLGPLTLITPTMTLFANGTFQHGTIHHRPAHFTTDLYLLAYANVFIGNCISSYSAFVSRYRRYQLGFHQTTHFFSYQPWLNQGFKHFKDEL